MKSTALLLFLRVPEKGQVKTRLSKRLDKGFVLELYKAFVLDLLAAVSHVSPLFLFFWPPDKQKELTRWLGKTYRYQPQQGGDIGVKMGHAFETVFCKGFDKAILVGTDIPEIDRPLIDRAVERLNQNDAVLGPSPDGGYYLIGLKRKVFSPSFFNGIPWSGPDVLDQTLILLENRSIQYHLLEELNDIDTMADFNGLCRGLSNNAHIGVHTRKVLENHAL